MSISLITYIMSVRLLLKHAFCKVKFEITLQKACFSNNHH